MPIGLYDLLVFGVIVGDDSIKVFEMEFLESIEFILTAISRHIIQASLIEKSAGAGTGSVHILIKKACQYKDKGRYKHCRQTVNGHPKHKAVRVRLGYVAHNHTQQGAYTDNQPSENSDIPSYHPIKGFHLFIEFLFRLIVSKVNDLFCEVARGYVYMILHIVVLRKNKHKNARAHFSRLISPTKPPFSAIYTEKNVSKSDNKWVVSRIQPRFCPLF